MVRARLDDKEQAAASYAKHDDFACETTARWVISEGGSGNFLTHIMSVPPFLIVVGDGPLCVFMGGYGKVGHLDGLAHVRWCARSNLDYLATKATIGMGDFAGREWGWEEARYDIRSVIAYLHEDDCEQEEIDAWGRLHDAIGDECTQDLMYQEANDAGIDMLDAPLENIGVRVHPRVVYAREACRTLLRLLGEEEAG